MGADPDLLNLNFEDDEIDLRLTGDGLRAATTGKTTAVVNASGAASGVGRPTRPKVRLRERVGLNRLQPSFDSEPDLLEGSVDTHDSQDNHDKQAALAAYAHLGNGGSPGRQLKRTPARHHTVHVAGISAAAGSEKPLWQRSRFVRVAVATASNWW